MTDVRHPLRPTEVGSYPPIFDRFATRAATLTGRAPFFAACVVAVVVWLPTLLFLPLNTSQLIMNTISSIVTFLLIALQQNSSSRSDAATAHKLNELADALANLIAAMPIENESLRRDVAELKAAVGLEERERS
jgi:low affinity Fe/Cu permease